MPRHNLIQAPRQCRAIQVARELHKVGKEAIPKENKAYVPLVYTLGRILMAEGKLKEAQPYYVEAYKVSRRYTAYDDVPAAKIEKEYQQLLAKLQ